MSGSGYRAFLSTKYVPQLVVSMTLARLPVGVVTIVLVIFINLHYNATISGFSTAAFMGGMAVISPLFGRMVDRGWAPPLLRVTAILALASVLMLVWSVLTEQPPYLVILTALATGTFMPPVAAVTRSLWPVMLDIELISTAYNFDLLIVDVLYVGGPLVASIFVGMGIPEWGLILTTIGSTIGTLILSTIKPVIDCAHHNNKRSKRIKTTMDAVKAPLWCLPLVILMIALFSRIMFAAWLETEIPLYFTDMGNAMLGSVVISAWSVGSASGSIFFNRFQPSPRTMSTPMQLVVFTAVVLGISFIVPFGMSVVSMSIVLYFVGAVVAFTDNLYYQIAGNITPHERQGEMFSWMNTAYNVGLSAGAFVAGLSVENLGYHASFSLPAVCVIVSFVLTVFAFFAIKRHKARKDAEIAAIKVDTNDKKPAQA